MKITISDDFKKCEVESGDVNANDVLMLFLDAMLGFGFHKESVMDAIEYCCYEYGVCGDCLHKVKYTVDI